jgi:hypothetical protein
MRQGNLTPCFQPLSTVLYSTVEYRQWSGKSTNHQWSYTRPILLITALKPILDEREEGK